MLLQQRSPQTSKDTNSENSTRVTLNLETMFPIKKENWGLARNQNVMRPKSKDTVHPHSRTGPYWNSASSLTHQSSWSKGEASFTLCIRLHHSVQAKTSVLDWMEQMTRVGSRWRRRGASRPWAPRRRALGALWRRERWTSLSWGAGQRSRPLSSCLASAGRWSSPSLQVLHTAITLQQI
jgi:hypothetical protein